jgi:hypothetical protein
LGLLGIQAINVFLLSLMTILSVLVLGGGINSLVYWSIGFIFLESLLLLLVVILLSLIANNILSALLSVVVLVLGHSVKETQNLSLVKNSQFLKTILNLYHFILPGFYKLNLKEHLLYKASLPFEYLISTLTYGVCYSGFLLIMIIFIFNRKNID